MAKFRIEEREKHLERAIKTIYKKQIRGMLKRIPLDLTPPTFGCPAEEIRCVFDEI